MQTKPPRRLNGGEMELTYRKTIHASIEFDNGETLHIQITEDNTRPNREWSEEFARFTLVRLCVFQDYHPSSEAIERICKYIGVVREREFPRIRDMHKVADPHF